MSKESIYLNLDDAIARMGDRETFLEISQYFALRLPDALKELDAALNAGDIATATRYAHSMKSNCGAMGADQLHELCHALERICRREEIEGAKKLYAELVPRMRALRSALLAL